MAQADGFGLEQDEAFWIDCKQFRGWIGPKGMVEAGRIDVQRRASAKQRRSPWLSSCRMLEMMSAASLWHNRMSIS